MSKNVFRLNTSAFRKEVLQADWMKTFMESEATKIADQDSHIKAFIGFDRAKAIIYPNTKENPE